MRSLYILLSVAALMAAEVGQNLVDAAKDGDIHS